MSKHIEDNISIVLDPLAEKIRRKTKSISCSIYLFDKDRTELRLRGSSVSNGEPEKRQNKDYYKEGDGLTWKIADKGSLVNVTSLYGQNNAQHKYRNHEGPFLGIPLIHDQYSRGVIKLVREKGKSEYQDKHIKYVINKIPAILKEIRKQLKHSEAKSDLRSYQNYNLSLEPEDGLISFYQNLSNIHDLDELFNKVLSELSIRCRAASIFQFDKEGQLSRTHQIWHYNALKPIDDQNINRNFKETYSLNEDSLVCLAARYNNNKGQIIKIDNLEAEEIITGNPKIKHVLTTYEKLNQKLYGIDEKIAHGLFIPIRSRTRTFGVVCLLNKLSWSKFDPKGFRPEDIKFAEALVGALSTGTSRIKNESKYDITTELNKLIGKNIIAKDKYNIICNTITNHLTSYSCCVIRMLDKMGKPKIVGITNGYVSPPIEVDTVKRNYLITKVLQTSKTETCHIENLDKNNGVFNLAWMKAMGFKSLVYQPIVDENNQVYGVMCLYTKFKFDFSDKHLSNIKELANQVANLMEEENERFREKSILQFSSDLETEESRWKKYDKSAHNTFVRRILQESILRSEKYTRVDQCLVARSIPERSANPEFKELEIFESLSRLQKGEILHIPREFRKEIDAKGYYIFSSDKHADSKYLQNEENLVHYTEQILFMPLDVALDRYLIDEDKDLSNIKLSHYYILFVLLKSPYEFREKRRIRTRIKELNANNDSITLFKYFSTEVTKFLKHIKKNHDFHFVSEIVDNIIKSKNERKTLETILEEIKLRTKWVLAVNLVFFDNHTGEVIEILGHDIEQFNQFNLFDEGITNRVYETKRSYTYPSEKEIDKLAIDCCNEELRDINKIHISPMIYENEVIGFLYVFAKTSSAFGEEHGYFRNDYKYFIDAVADQIAVGISKLELHKTPRDFARNFIHSNKNLLKWKVLSPLKDLQSANPTGLVRDKINSVTDTVSEVIRKSVKQVTEVTASRNEPISFSLFKEICEKIKNESRTDFELIIRNGLKDSSYILAHEITLTILLKDLIENAIEGMEEGELYLKKNASQTDKRIEVCWNEKCIANKYFIEISVFNTGSALHSDVNENAGFRTLKSDKDKGTGMGLKFLNDNLKLFDCLKYYKTNPVRDQLKVFQVRYFDIRQIQTPDLGVLVTFCFPKQNFTHKPTK